jgi:hypothetical protein
MGLLKWFRKKEKIGSSQFPGERLSIDKILELGNTTEMIIELSYGISDKISRAGFDSLSHAEKVLYRIYWLETEVNNGGFDQYFFNTSGNYAIDTPEDLEEIGAHHTAQIVRDAISIFPGGSPPRSRDDRDKLYDLVTDEVRDKWYELDLKFYEYQDPLETLQIGYVTNNKDEINV